MMMLLRMMICNIDIHEFISMMMNILRIWLCILFMLSFGLVVGRVTRT